MCVDTELPRGDSGAAEKPYQQRPQQQGWQGALWGPALGWGQRVSALSLIHISEPTRLRRISYAVFCLKRARPQPIPKPLSLIHI